MPLFSIITFILGGTLLLLCVLDSLTKGLIFRMIDKTITNCRKRKNSRLFSYIDSYNDLAKSFNEIYEKDYLPNLKKINYFYNNAKYFPQNEIKSRQLELEHQKRLLQDAKEDMKKIWNNAQEYYKLIENYTKAYRSPWINEYLDGFPSF